MGGPIPVAGLDDYVSVGFSWNKAWPPSPRVYLSFVAVPTASALRSLISIRSFKHTYIKGTKPFQA